MAKRTEVKVFDDLDGSEGAATVEFGMDGVRFEIDLNEVHEKELRELLDPYVRAGRRVSGRVTGQPRSTGGAASRRAENQAIRVWAGENGWDVAERGRIPANVVEAYREAA